ncbi:MAG: ATP-binding protein [Deltaproteobacteria bacterium]|nr:ATP-binding protein [Deltaproteobacteria bacterium]
MCCLFFAWTAISRTTGLPATHLVCERHEKHIRHNQDGLSARYHMRFWFVICCTCEGVGCPCGYFGDARSECRCSVNQVARYLGRVSGPLMDRIDLHVEVPAVRYREIAARGGGESSQAIRERVVRARLRQGERFTDSAASCNAEMPARMIKNHCALDADGHRIMESVMERLGLSARAHDRILKVARTIADLDGSDAIRATHIAEAVQYRGLDRTLLAIAA